MTYMHTYTVKDSLTRRRGRCRRFVERDYRHMDNYRGQVQREQKLGQER